MNLPEFNTAATDALCKEIAKKSHGTIFLMLSGGKDSLCAWLQLQKYFPRIIPFHCASLPGYEYVDNYLDYLEYKFQTRILRLMGEDLKMALVRHVYQVAPWECDLIDDSFEDKDFSKLDVLEYLRMKFNLPRAWCAVGISMNDSIDRLIYCRKTGGKNEANRTFYPCWDWPRAALLDAIYESGIEVAPEYKYTKRSMGGVPSATYNKVMMEHFPRDWERTKFWYPLAEVKNYREEMIDNNYQKWREQQAQIHLKVQEALDSLDEPATNGGMEVLREMKEILAEGQEEAEGPVEILPLSGSKFDVPSSGEATPGIYGEMTEFDAEVEEAKEEEDV